MNPDLQDILARLTEAKLADGLTMGKNPGPSGQDSLLVPSSALVEVMRFLRDSLGFDFLSNVTGVDWPDPALAAKVVVLEGIDPGETGFIEAVYHLYSTTRRLGPLVLRARTKDRGDGAELPSVTPVFRSAEFQEREIYDLFGVSFTGHPDLRRILMWDEFVDHPMRKDYLPPSDHQYEPTPHDHVLELAKQQSANGKEAT